MSTDTLSPLARRLRIQAIVARLKKDEHLPADHPVDSLKGVKINLATSVADAPDFAELKEIREYGGQIYRVFKVKFPDRELTEKEIKSIMQMLVGW